MSGHGAEGKIVQMMHKLELSDEQQTQIWKIVDEKRVSKMAAMKEAKSNREAMREMMHSGSYDAEKVKEHADQQGEQLSNRIVQRAEVMNSIRQVLTTEQVAQLDELRQGRNERALW